MVYRYDFGIYKIYLINYEVEKFNDFFLFFFEGIFVQSVDRYNEDSEHQDGNTERTNTTPLLEEKTIETDVGSSEA